MTEIYESYDDKLILSARHFRTMKPPIGAFYVGEKVINGHTYYLWVIEGIYYAETNAECSVKKLMEKLRQKKNRQ